MPNNDQHPGEPTMRLWTIQCPGAWELAQCHGVPRGDGRRIAFVDFRPAYRWLMEQMRCRVPGYRGRYPIWAWPKKPDLRRSGYYDRGTPAVRIEFVAPSRMVLLSEHQAWHVILRQGDLPLTWEESDVRERRGQEATGERFPRFEHLPAALQAEVRATWERVFDFDALVASELWCEGDPDRLDLQAVVEQVPLEWVVRVTPFVAR